MKIDFCVDLIDNFYDIWFAYNIAKILVEKDENIFIRFFSNNENLFNNISKINIVIKLNIIMKTKN